MPVIVLIVFGVWITKVYQVLQVKYPIDEYTTLLER